MIDLAFVMRLGDKDYVVYAGVLKEAHNRGLTSIETSLVQIPGLENEYTAIVKATVTMKDGSRFEDFGDASPRNVNSRIATALIRMSATRAKGRALRDACNIGYALIEDAEPEDEPARINAPKNPAAKRAQPMKAKEPATWDDPGTGRRYTRQDLLFGIAKLSREAAAAGCPHIPTDWDAMTNPDLFEAGVRLKTAIMEAQNVDLFSDEEVG